MPFDCRPEPDECRKCGHLRSPRKQEGRWALQCNNCRRKRYRETNRKDWLDDPRREISDPFVEFSLEPPERIAIYQARYLRQEPILSED